MRARSGFPAITAGAAALVMMITAPTAADVGYPDRPITLIVAYEAGAATDVTARMLAPFLEKHLDGARIEVVNRPGAGGEIGFAALAGSPADGYTIGFINTPNLVSIPIERQARFSLDGVDPLVNIVDEPAVWTVPADSPFRTVADAINQAQANPDAVTLGTTGVGSDDQLAMLLVQRQARVQFSHVPFSSPSAKQKALVAKRIDVGGQTLGEGLRAMATGQARILGVMSNERWKSAPDLPTFKEQGVPVVMASLRGIGAPKGLPTDVRGTLVKALIKAARDPDFIAQAEATDRYQPLRVLMPEAFAAELARLDAELRALWQSSPWLK